MTARLPHCAYCGKPLAGALPRVVVTDTDLPGGPSWGWHMDQKGLCYTLDKEAKRIQWPTDGKEAAQWWVNTLAERGLKRVVFTRKVS